MRFFINLVEAIHNTKMADTLKDFDGEALKPNCTKMIPDEIKFADFCFVWWVGGDDDEMEKKRDAIQEAEENAEKKDVLHSDMVTGQISVNPEKIDAIITNPPEDDNNLPIIHFWNGYHILFDGNHRVVADVLKGNKSTKCFVANLNKAFDNKGMLKK